MPALLVDTECQRSKRHLPLHKIQEGPAYFLSYSPTSRGQNYQLATPQSGLLNMCIFIDFGGVVLDVA